MDNFSIKNKSLCDAEQMSLFSSQEPLAYRIRPKSLDEIIGQEHLFSKEGVLSKWFHSNFPYSIVLWGNPGSGKTTISLIAKYSSNKEFIYIHGANTSVNDLRATISKSNLMKGRVILFIDEIHRLIKSQQDILLEPLENGCLTLIGTTTENPLVSLTKALHSRVKVLELIPPTNSDLEKIIDRALSHPLGIKGKSITQEAKNKLISSCSSDIRRLLSLLEESGNITNENNLIDEKVIERVLKNSQLQIGADPNSYYHYISALQKSIRGSDPDAALYWLARLLSGGIDPVQIARRVLVTASEDIGLANNNALQVAVNAYFSCQNLGMPEARIPLAHAVIYLANSPKSNTVIKSIDKALYDAMNLPQYSVPIHIRNMGQTEYKYPHDYPDAKIVQNYLPKDLLNNKYFEPNERDKNI